MQVIRARNAHQALPEVMYQLKSAGLDRPSRNGNVKVFPEPTTFVYEKPLERVVFWEERDANPFFHLFESLWMLAGRNDVAFPAFFSSNIAQFSDDGETFHGAYGHRWRRHFVILTSIQKGPQTIDQLATIAAALKKDPNDRRQVLQMWDATSDLGGQGKDLPCNLMIVFQRNKDGALNMTVYNRSNDIVWGALGANCVHMSYLQEFMAAWIGCPVGKYWQVSTNMHGYVTTAGKVETLADKAFPSKQYEEQCPYACGFAKPFPLVNTDISTWQRDLAMFLEVGGDAMGYTDPFFRRVAIPMFLAYKAFKIKDDDRFRDAQAHIDRMPMCDWKIACHEWLHRRWAKAQAKASPTVENNEA